MNWSTSKLALADVCAFAFKQDHDGRPRPPQPALDGGSSAHEAIAAFVGAVVSGDPIDVRALARSSPGRPEERAGVLAILTLMQEELLDDEAPLLDARAVMYVERRLAMTIGPHVFDGKPDLVQRFGRTCVVDDFKTHWRPESQETFEADPQVPRYALLVDHNHPGQFDEFVVRKRFVRYRGAVREMTLERHHLAAAKWDLVQEIEEREQLLARGEFPATPGDWCAICARTDVCPVYKTFTEDGVELAVPDDTKAAELAGVVRVIDAQSAKLKRLLKTYLGHDHPTGRVELSGGTYGFGPSSHKRAHVDDVFEVYEAHERPVNRHALRVDVDALKRGLDREPGNVRRALKATIEEYDQAECRYRRGDGQEETTNDGGIEE